MTRITSRDNRNIKDIIKLMNSSRARRERGLFAVEGVRICCDAYDSGIAVETLLYSDSAAEKYPDVVERLSVAAETVFSASDDVFSRTADTKTPQGVLLVCRMPQLRLDTDSIRPCGRYAALENLSDPANLGTISRTAEALGIDGLILSKGCCDPYSPKALRAGMGSLMRIPLIQTEDFFAELNKFRAAGLPVYAAVPDRSASRLGEKTLSGGAVVMIGNEGNGLTAEAQSFADDRITIPMAGRAESLNAAAAASILMWEMVR